MVKSQHTCADKSLNERQPAKTGKSHPGRVKMIASFITAGQYLDIDDELYFLHEIVLIMLKYKYDPPPPTHTHKKKKKEKKAQFEL